MSSSFNGVSSTFKEVRSIENERSQMSTTHNFGLNNSKVNKHATNTVHTSTNKVVSLPK